MSAPAHPPSGRETPRVSLGRFIAALEAAGVWHTVKGDKVRFRCPLPDHEDTHASAEADWRPTDRNGRPPGRVLLLCRVCEKGRTPDIVAALGLDDVALYDDEPTRPDPSSLRARRGPSRQAGPGSTTPRSSPAPSPARADKSTPPPSASRAPSTLTARYEWEQASGELTHRLSRFDPVDPTEPNARKSFNWQHRGATRWEAGTECRGYCGTCRRGFDPSDVYCPGCGARRVCARCEAGATPPVPALHRLPEVTTAVAAGARVWVVEGGKNAADMRAALPDGEVVTTAPDGGAKGSCEGKWRPEATAALTGSAPVTIVADRDLAGYALAAYAAGELRAAGVSVRVVRTPLEVDKADASDHLAADLGLDAFEPVPTDVLGLPAELPDGDGDAADAAVLPGPWGDQGEREGGDEEPSGRRRGGGGSGGGNRRDVATVYVRDEFGLARGFGEDRDALVKVKYTEETDRKPAGRTLIEVLDADVRIVRRLHRDLGDGTDPGTTHVDLEATRDGETVALRDVEWDDFRKCTFLARLPWSVSWRDTPAGRSDVVNAITARSGPVPVVPTYGTLGWWETTPGRWVYMHAGGGLDAAGPVPGVQTALSPRLRGFTLPTPPETADDVAAALDGVLSVLDELPARVAAPVMGAPLRATLGETRTSVFVIGYTGARKSGLAALAQQMHYPAARHDRLPLGAGEMASTATATEHLMWEAAHALLVADDLAPDRSAERSASRANELLRTAANGTARARGSRTGGLREDRPPQSMLLVTGEDGASRLSAESRTTYVQLAPAHPTDPESGDVPLSVIQGLSTRERIAGRNATAAALVRHVASRMPVTEWVETTRDELAAALLADWGHLDPDGLMPRRALAVAELATGWRALLEMARDTGALEPAELTRVWARVWAGLGECLTDQAEVSDRRAMVEHAADLLRSAIRSGSAHLEDTDGGCPATFALRGACGWEPYGDPAQGEYRATGKRAGWTDGERVWLDPGAAFAVIEAQGAAERDPLNVARRALTAALLASRVVATERQEGRRNPSAQVRRRVGGQRQRVWDAPWSWLWPDGEQSGGVPPDGPTGDPTDGPTEGADDAGPAGGATPPLFPTGPAESGAADPATPPAGAELGDEAGAAVRADDGPGNAPESPQDAPESRPGVLAPATRDKSAQGRSGRHERTEETSARYAASAVVVDVDGAWLATSGPGAVERPEVDSLAALLDWAATLRLGTAHDRSRDDSGQVWVLPSLARKLGLRGKRPPKDSGRTALVRSLEAAGWKLGRAGLSDWTHCYRPGSPGLWLVVVPWFSQHEMCDPNDPPPGAALADRIELVRDLLGQPYLMSPGATGTALLALTQSTASKGRLREPIEQPPPALAKRCNLAEPEWNWRRAVSTEEASRATRAVRYDVNAQYLAAAALTELGLGDPEHVTDPDRLAGALTTKALPPGYWLVDRVPGPHPELPDLLDADQGADGQLWVTTPSLRAVLEAGYTLDAPREAWVWPDQTRWLQRWAEGLRDARDFLTDARGGVDPDGNLAAAAQAVKFTYAAGVGMLGSLRFRGPSPDKPRGSWDFRPDARHHVIATAKANLWRKVLRTALDPADGRVPVAITRDAVVYLAGPEHDDKTAPAGFKLGTKLGTVKIEETMTVEDALNAYADTPTSTPGE